MSAAVLDNIASEPSEQEFLLIGTSGDHRITGVEIGLARAMLCARGLALGGWRVKVESADPYLEDPVIMEVWCEESP